MKPYALPDTDPDAPGQLYNLADDPMEEKDLSGDPVQKQQLEKMKKELDAWMRSVIPVLIGPGQTTFTRMSRLARSTAAARARFTTPPLAAL